MEATSKTSPRDNQLSDLTWVASTASNARFQCRGWSLSVVHGCLMVPSVATLEREPNKNRPLGGPRNFEIHPLWLPLFCSDLQWRPLALLPSFFEGVSTKISQLGGFSKLGTPTGGWCAFGFPSSTNRGCEIFFAKLPSTKTSWPFFWRCASLSWEVPWLLHWQDRAVLQSQ